MGYQDDGSPLHHSATNPPEHGNVPQSAQVLEQALLANIEVV
jgi:hypothetical protein